MKRILTILLAMATLSAATAAPTATMVSGQSTPVKYDPCLPC